LNALQLGAIEIDPGDVTGAEAVAADLDDVVVVFEVGLGEFEDRFGFEGVDEGGVERELEVALQVFVLRFGDLRCFFGALQTQFALASRS